jgi:hypothetical protein
MALGSTTSAKALDCRRPDPLSPHKSGRWGKAAVLIEGTSSAASALKMTPCNTPERLASAPLVHRRRARAARIWAPVIGLSGLKRPGRLLFAGSSSIAV